MVDYTKPAMRDESWRRWKGGKKLADELRLFYTSKTALDRIARATALATGKPAANGDTSAKRKYSTFRLLMEADRLGKGQSRKAMQIARRSLGRNAGKATTVLPGQVAPKR